MAVRHGLFVANGTAGVTSPQDARLALAALLSGPGVLNGFTVTGSTSGPNMKYLVAAGAVATQRGTLSADGLYLWTNDGVYTADSGAPAPASGSRYDVIYALHRNANDGFGDANSDPIIDVVRGTASSTPTMPAVPAGALALAQALVGTSIANASLAAITPVAAKTTLPGQLIGQSQTNTPIGLTTTSAFAGAARVVFTLPVARSVRIVVVTQYQATSATRGRFTSAAGYNTGGGAVIGSFAQAGLEDHVMLSASGDLGGVTTEGVVSLAAGTYTAYASVQRPTGGSTGDQCNRSYTAVYDAGPA
jgi:hypothetical protein